MIKVKLLIPVHFVATPDDTFEDSVALVRLDTEFPVLPPLGAKIHPGGFADEDHEVDEIAFNLEDQTIEIYLDGFEIQGGKRTKGRTIEEIIAEAFPNWSVANIC